jgi:flagellar biosynthesis/type III secretory pathway protein FliH
MNRTTKKHIETKKRTTRATRAEHDAQLRALYADGHSAGLRQGEKQAQEKFNLDLRITERKTSIELAKSLGQMVEATARAVVAFCSELGLRN